MVPVPVPGLLDLSRKYQVLLRLREASDRRSPDLRLTMRAVASEFPGALRELDVLPIETLRSRAAAVSRALEGAPLQHWIEPLYRYHRTMRLALTVKLRVAGRRLVSRADAERLARIACEREDWPCDANFVAQVAQPPLGRLNLAVARRIEDELRLPSGRLIDWLFPRSEGRAAGVSPGGPISRE